MNACLPNNGGCTGLRHTDDGGVFSFVLPFGEYSLHLTTQDDFRGYYADIAPGNFTFLNDDLTTIIVGPHLPQPVTIQLPRASTVLVTVVDTEGNPLAGATLSACLADGTWYNNTCPLRRQIGEDIKQLALTLPSTGGLYLSVRHAGDIWFYNSAADGNVSRSPAQRTALQGGPTAPQELSLTIPITPRDYVISYTLSPGANLIGWHGGSLTVADFFEQAPSVVGLIRLHSDGSPGQSAFRYASAHQQGLDTLEYGDAAWAYVATESAVSMRIRTTQPRVGLDLDAGVTYVAWPGPDATALESVARSLGDSLISIHRAQYPPADSDAVQADTVDRGDVLRVELSFPAVAPPKFEATPEVILIGDEAESERTDIEATLTDVRDFYLAEFGVSLIDFATYYSANWEEQTGWAFGWPAAFASEDLWLQRWVESTIAHEYFHVLQKRLSGEHGSIAWNHRRIRHLCRGDLPEAAIGQ